MSIKIFAVDDEDYIREVLELNIKPLKNITLKVFSSAAELLAELKSELADIIISDVIMPDIDGLELCRIIKNTAEYKNIYFIMLTAKVSVDDKVSGLEAGADDYITKPFKFKELIARINLGARLINSRRENLMLIEELKTKNLKLEDAYGKLNEATKKIVIAEKLTAIGKISSIIAHELKNPLAAVSNNLQALKKAGNISNEIYENVKKNIDYSAEILNKIPTFSDNQTILFEKIEINELINECLLNISIPANIKISFDYKEKVFLNCDKFGLKIVIINILKNAVEKFAQTPTNGKINIFCYNENDDYTVIKIIDNGAPVPPHIDVFESFATTKKGGLGLGLAFSKLIVERNNGELTCENTESGVCFKLIFKKL